MESSKATSIIQWRKLIHSEYPRQPNHIKSWLHWAPLQKHFVLEDTGRTYSFLHRERICQLFALQNEEGKYGKSRQITPSRSLTPRKHKLLYLMQTCILAHKDPTLSRTHPSVSWGQPATSRGAASPRSRAGEDRVLVSLYAITHSVEKWAWQTPHLLLRIYALREQCEDKQAHHFMFNIQSSKGIQKV